MSKPVLRETMRAEMNPDMYGGKECDQMEPRWWCYADGDKDGDFNHEPLTLDAQLFPPGTVISIQEPTCPKCEETREPINQPVLGGPTFLAKCRCGFDWDNWTAEQYS
jgi:hypothetical protein